MMLMMMNYDGREATEIEFFTFKKQEIFVRGR
jgi:hypothetical protein